MAIIAENVNVALHGQVGHNWIYWVVKGEQFKRPYKIPYDPKTFSQKTQRNKFYMVSQMWGELTPEEKAEWKEKVQKSQEVMTAYNYFMREKIKEIEPMIKRIIRKTELLSDGLNVLTITEIDPDKSVLFFNCFLAGNGLDPAKQYGIYRAVINSPTELRVHARDPGAIGDLRIHYQIVEYV